MDTLDSVNVPYSGSLVCGTTVFSIFGSISALDNGQEVQLGRQGACVDDHCESLIMSADYKCNFGPLCSGNYAARFQYKVTLRGAIFTQVPNDCKLTNSQRTEISCTLVTGSVFVPPHNS